MDAPEEHIMVWHGDTEEAASAVKQWFEQVVLGLNLCPFAHQPAKQGLVRFAVLSEPEELLARLESEIALLEEQPVEQLETTLLIAPVGFDDFWYFNEVLAAVEQWLKRAGYEGFVQVASFHPDYQFAGTLSGDVENLTNCSPYPVFHLIREQSLTAAIDRGADTQSIPERNIETVCNLSQGEKERLFPYLFSGR